MRKPASKTVLLLVALLALIGCNAVAAPNGGRVSSTDYEEILAATAMSSEEVPERDLMFVTAGPLTETQRAELQHLGIGIVSAVGNTIHVRGPITAFEGLGPGSPALPWVYSVLPSPFLEVLDEPSLSVASAEVVREEIGADRLHEKGFRGAGVNIAILDNSFSGNVGDEFGTHRISYYRLTESLDGQAPNFVPGLDTTSSGDHGEACARAILDIAPEANLFLLSTGTINGRKEALRLLATGQLDVGGETVEIDVVSDSTACPYPFDHGDGRGDIAQLGDAIVDAGIVYVNALGNSGRGENTTMSFFGGSFEDADGDGLLDLTPDATDPILRNTIDLVVDPFIVWLVGGAFLRFSLEWDGWPWLVREDAAPEAWDPEDFIRVQDLDLVVYRQDQATGELTEVARSDTPQLRRTSDGGLVPPTENLQFIIGEGGTYKISIENSTGRYPLAGPVERSVSVHLHVRSSAPFTLTEHTESGSFVNMGGATKPIGVGAVELTAEGWCVAPYSSRGPTSDGRVKPEIVAPTHFATVVPGYAPCFEGTSASAPIVAGAAALLVNAARAEGIPYTPETIKEALLHSAEMLCGGCNPECSSMSSAPGAPEATWREASFDTGFGLVDVWSAYQFLTAGEAD